MELRMQIYCKNDSCVVLYNRYYREFRIAMVVYNVAGYGNCMVRWSKV